ncbi:MAG: N-acetyltransferase [Alphaproteobacteria bacterium]|nr:N-acetyltransferase [Alphaproteobacteria bacterium]
MSEVTITRHENGSAGEYHAHVEGSERIGRLTWVQRDGMRVAEYTIVPPAIGGRGVADKLIDALVADAREQAFNVKPVCSYVVAKFDEHRNGRTSAPDAALTT